MASDASDRAVSAALRALGRQFPDLDAAEAEIARLSGELTLPMGTVHVVSDIHGDYKKLRHILANGSGTLRPLVEGLFAGRLDAPGVSRLLGLVFYPAEAFAEHAPPSAAEGERRAFVTATLAALCEIARALAAEHSLEQVEAVLPAAHKKLVLELLFGPRARQGYLDAVARALAVEGYDERLLRIVARVVRNLSIDELVVAGDCYDRGPRGDRVVDLITRQPNVAFVWGNHDVAWLGAALGAPALIAHVIRLSARYRVLSQLEEGYGITLQPFEHLVRAAYGDDPAEAFGVKGTGLRDEATMRRIQKAAAVMQFKLEGQMIARHPEWGIAHRDLVSRLDLAAGAVTIDGKRWPLRDARLPTVRADRPLDLSADEAACLERTRQSFLTSDKLWQHMQFLCGHGSTYLVRDQHLIFHGCIPVDGAGAELSLAIDGVARQGKGLFDAFDAVIARALRERREGDLDLLWYLWCGPRSPLFGKERITTFERHFVADEVAHKEPKNPYYGLIHDADFCGRVLAAFGVDPARGMIVNGHVPVKLERGEDPVKKSGKAVTIDGEFAEAYGDHGFTLVLDAARTWLAEHHHFESVAAAVERGEDIIPTVRVIAERPARTIRDTERGAAILGELQLLRELARRYKGDPKATRS